MERDGVYVALAGAVLCAANMAAVNGITTGVASSVVKAVAV